MLMPLITISIVTYNCSQWIDSFFSSLQNQQYPLDKISLLLRDNGSSDDTVSKVNNIKEKYGCEFHQFSIFNDKNNGFGCAHNANIALATTDYVLVTNPDLTFEENAIVTIVTMAISDQARVASWELRQKPYEHPKPYHPVTLETEWSSAACILYRRSAFLAVGGYEARIFLYGEDTELSYHFRQAGFILKYCPKAVCWHYSYQFENEVKPQQFIGSITASLYIRMRYGNSLSILTAFCLYFLLFFLPRNVPHKNKLLVKNFVKILKNMPYFLGQRKKMANFPLLSFDYVKNRLGAFYELKPLPVGPLVSIIIRTQSSRQAFLKEAMTSILNQTYSNIEIILIEDGSDINKAYVEILKQQGYRISYESIQKSGRCVAGNRGLALAQGEYIGFLDDDDLLFADHIEILVNALLANPNYAAAYANAFEVPTIIKNLSPLEYTEYGYHFAKMHGFSRPQLWLTNYIPIQTILFKKALYEQYGGFDLDLNCLEDWNLWMRYSSNADFLYVLKTTSLFRTLADYKQQIKRYREITSYRKYIVEKRNQLTFHHISLSEMQTYTKELLLLNQRFSISYLIKLGLNIYSNKCISFILKLSFFLKRVCIPFFSKK
ncbi:MAG: hypothetical protein LEGION0398_MBIBDBAK_00587 [Legionellaceae bacterium]